MLQDKFLPAEWLNTIFVDILNCDIITRPSQQWFLHPLYFLKKRNGLQTVTVGGTNQWLTTGNITGASYNSLNIYPYTASWYLYKFDGSTITTLTSATSYNGTDFTYKTIDVAFGSWRYPDKYTRFTVASYDAINAEITINETLSAWQQLAMVSKYVYVKASSTAQWWFRAIESIPSSTKIRLTSWFWTSPWAWDTLFIYDALVSQTLYPQLREWASGSYKFYVTWVSVTPTASATYTNNGYTFTVVSTDISWWNWTIIATWTWAPQLAGNLSKSAWTWDATIAFYDSDNWQDRLVWKDTNEVINYLYFPNDRKLVKWDNKLIWLHKNRQYIIPHNSEDIEIILSTKLVNLGTAQAMNIDVFSWYLIVFFADKIWILKKTITDPSTQDYAYVYQDLLNFWLFSENSYIIYGWNFYVYANDNRLYSISISSTSWGDILAKADDQWMIMVNYFSTISAWDVRFTYMSGTLRLIHDTGTETNVYKYIENYKAWIRDTYPQYWNLFLFHYNIDDTEFICHANSIYAMLWIKDIATNITEKIQIYGPVQSFNDIFMLTAFKIRLWFDGISPIWWKLKLNVGGSYKYYIEKDITTLNVIDLINQYIIWWGMMWWWLQWDYIIWGWEGIGQIEDYFAEFIDIKFVVWKEWSRFDLVIENSDDTQLFFGWAVALYTQNNPEVLYVKNTL